MNSLVSIIIPVFNRGHLIGQTLNSLRQQDYTHWECIIIDDGSQDDTQAVVNSYQKKDQRIQYHKRPDNRPKGANACRNYGFEISRGDYINWFDSDDLMLPHFISSRLKKIDGTETLDAVIGYAIYFNEDGTEEIVKPETLNSENALYSFIAGSLFFSTPGPLWKRKFLEDKKLFNESYQKIQDIEFHFRMLMHHMQFKFYEKDALFKVRRGTHRISNKSTLSEEKLQNVLDYHYLTFKNRNLISPNHRQSYHFITSKKVLSGFYELMSFTKDFRQRFTLYKKNKIILKDVTGKYSLIKKTRLLFALSLVIIFKKGYKYFVNA